MRSRRFLLCTALVAAGLLIRRLPGERRVSIEALEDEDVAQAYQRVTDLPQFALIYWLVARRAVGRGFTGKAIDVGGGPGKLAIRLARMAPQAEVVSLDPSEEMVKLAGERAAREGLSGRVRGALGSSEHIPFPDASFDLVVSTLSLHHWKEPVLALREIERVVKPDGRVLIVDARRDVALLPWLLLKVIQRILPFAALRRAGEPTGSFQSSYTPDEVAALLRLAGLSRWQVTGGPAWLLIER